MRYDYFCMTCHLEKVFDHKNIKIISKIMEKIRKLFLYMVYGCEQLQVVHVREL